MTEMRKLEQFHVVGVAGEVIPQGAPGFNPMAIPALWDELMAHLGSQAETVGPMYGVGQMDYATGKLHYVAGYASAETPEGLAGIEVPAGDYYVLTHIGSLEGLGQSLGQFFGQTVHAEQLKLGGGPFVEVYTDEFVPGSPDSKFDTLFPVG